MCSPVLDDLCVCGSEGTTVFSKIPFMANNPELSDIRFIFNTEDGEKIIYGHKLILALASPVFREMFYSNNEEFKTIVEEGQVNMDDHDFFAESFLPFIKCVYTDKNYTVVFVGLSVEVIIGIMAFAHYYEVPHIKNGCLKHLEKILDEGNAILILGIALASKEEELRNKVLEFIDRNPIPVCESDKFGDADAETLFEIFKRDTLSMDESHVFDFSMAWAEKKCKEMDLEPIGKNKRKVLGPAFFEIRFALLPATKVSDLIHSGCLSREEGVEIWKLDSVKFIVELNGSVVNVYSFKSKPRVFSQKNRIMEGVAGGFCRAEAKLFISGLPLQMNEFQVRDRVNDAVPDNTGLEVKKFIGNRAEFKVKFFYNLHDYGPRDFYNPNFFGFNYQDLRITIQNYV